MEILIAVSIALSAVLFGYMLGVEKARRATMADLEAKALALNTSIEGFGKAYSDFNARALEIESRFATLEFKLTGVTGKN